MFDIIQSWWLGSSTGPELLFLLRMCCGSLSTVGFLLAVWNVASPNEFEKLWTESESRRARGLGALKAVALLVISAYYITAGILEADRTSSPHRLLVANVGTTLLLASFILDGIFWRVHYMVKRARFGVRIR